MKEGKREHENIVEIEYATTSKTDSIIPTRVEEKTMTVEQGEVGQSSNT
jgi:hypothetical protein